MNPDVFGYAGSVTGVSILLPQVYKSYRTKSVEDISWGMLVIFFFNNIFWFLYGLFIGSVPVMLTNVLGLLVIFAQMALKVRYAKKTT